MSFVLLPLAFIEGVGGPEMVMILLVVLVLFGGQKLPEFARGLGKSIREFKKAAAGVEEEFKRAIEEDDTKKPAPKILPAAATVTSPAAPAALPPPGVVTPETTHVPTPAVTPALPPPASGFEHGRADV